MQITRRTFGKGVLAATAVAAAPVAPPSARPAFDAKAWLAKQEDPVYFRADWHAASVPSRDAADNIRPLAEIRTEYDEKADAMLVDRFHEIKGAGA